MQKRGLTLSRTLALAIIAGVGQGAACGALAASAPQLYAAEGGKIRAFIVGIDDYSSKKRLQGAVADARDIENSLKELGVPPSNMTVLIDQKATRKNFVEGIEKLVKETKPHDLVIISFAGHGARLPELHKNTKPDHKDEVYVLAKFDESVKTGYAERVHGPEMKHWLSQLDKKGADVLFIADTCHGAGMVRAVDIRQTNITYRQIDINKVAEEEDAVETPSTPGDAMTSDATSFPHVTFLAAVDRFGKAPEVHIEGQASPRGALSYSLARAFHGAADTSEKGGITRRELFEYANQVVRQFSDGRQHPYYEPTRDQSLDTVVFRTRSMEPATNPAAGNLVNNGGGTQQTPPATPVILQGDASGAKLSMLKVAVVNGDASAVTRVKPLSVSLSIVSDASQADLVWDAHTREAVTNGDIVARNVAAIEVPAVADRIASARALSALAAQRPQTISLKPGDALHREKEQLTVEATGLSGKYLIIFNITGNGLVQYLFPLKDDKALIQETNWKLPFAVTPPFGVDQVVAITSNRRLTDLERELSALNQLAAAGKTPEIIRKYVEANPDARVGLSTVATAP